MITAIRTHMGTLLTGISILRSWNNFVIFGRTEDEYDTIFNMVWSPEQQHKINSMFKEVYIGNKYASIKYNVEKVHWSKKYANAFCLECVLAKPVDLENNQIENEVYFIVIDKNGKNFTSINLKRFLKEYGVNYNTSEGDF